jgi:hypothetical protein
MHYHFMYFNLSIMINLEKRKRPGQGRQGWTEPTKIKETRTRVFSGSMLTYRREVGDLSSR